MGSARVISAVTMTGIFAVALMATVFGVLHPAFLLAAPVLAVTAGAIAAARRWPAHSLLGCVCAILIASTKFRLRDASASVSGEVDAQIVVELGLYALVALVMFIVAQGREFVAQPPSLTELALGGYCGIAVLSTAWSSIPTLTFIRGGQLIILLALACTIARVLTPQSGLRALLVPLVYYVIICAVLAKLFFWAKGTHVDYLGFRRFTWFAVHPIDAATLVALAMLFLLSELLYSAHGFASRLLRVPIVFYFVPLGAILVACNSRGPLIATAAAVAALLLRKRLALFSATMGLAVALIAAVAVVNSGETVASLLADAQASDNALIKLLFRGQTVDELSSFTDRSELWDATIGLIGSRPLLGFGYQGSRMHLLEIVPWAAYAHNALLQTLLDVGIIGTVLLWVPFTSTLHVGSGRSGALTEAARWTRGLAPGLTVFLIVNAFSSESFAGAPTYMTLLLFGSTIAASRLRRVVPSAEAVRATEPWATPLTIGTVAS